MNLGLFSSLFDDLIQHSGLRLEAFRPSFRFIPGFGRFGWRPILPNNSFEVSLHLAGRLRDPFLLFQTSPICLPKARDFWTVLAGR